MDEPDEDSPIELPCSMCEAGDPQCRACGGTGRQRHSRCPRKIIGQSGVQAVRMLELAVDGVLPVAGGALDQPQRFLDALAFYRRECDEWKAEQMRSAGA